jgi:antirestriction protein ArdC
MQAKQSISQSQHQSAYAIVTEQIIRHLEAGVVPWRKPWSTEAPVNLITQKAYRGINPFLLAPLGYGSKYWLTFNQAAKLRGHIRKGEKSSIVTFWNIGQEKIIRDTNGIECKSKPFLLRFYRVFNLEQTEGIAEKLGLRSSAPRIPNIEQCDAIISKMPNAPKREQSDRCWYRPASDTVGMVSRSLFNSAEEFYSTMFHELVHSTGHASRLGREGIETLNTFGSESYSKEELIAELGAAMLCGVTSIAPRTIENSAAYLKAWIERLRGDSKLIVSAASAAQKAADYIRNVKAVSAESEVIS